MDWRRALERTYQCDDSKELHMFPALLLEVGDVVAILL